SIAGNRPDAMKLLENQSVELGEGFGPCTLFQFSCYLSSPDTQSQAAVSVTFSGEENGKPVSWQSSWQPWATDVSDAWRHFSMVDTIPDRVLKLKDLKVSLMVAPFQTDELFLHRKKALNEVVAVRNARLTLLAPLMMPPPRSFKWMVY